MQNKQSFRESLKILNKFQESIKNISDNEIPENIEIDIALEKLSSIYNSMILWQNRIPSSKMSDIEKDDYVCRSEIKDIIADTVKAIEDERRKESSPDDEGKTESILEEEEVTKEDNFEVIKKPVKVPEPEEEVQLEKEIIESKPIPTPIQEKEKPKKETLRKTQVEVPEKKNIQNSNSGKIIGEQLGVDKKSLYDLISGNKGDKDIVSQFRKKPISNIHKAISLNDKIWFTKELFNGNSEQYKQAIDNLDKCTGL
ncbi:MAG: hypothetical protein U9R19_06605, partial [Bacteroidota bacterium]|nr:hypothetical protein [Bacteroidota bacterium]